MDVGQITKLNPKIEVLKEENPKIRCIFCHKSQINHMEWGPMCKLDDIIVHYFCMLFSSALRQNGKDTEGLLGFMPNDLWKEIRRGEKLKCKHCKLNCATVGCAVKQCKTSFHFSCGIPNGALNQFSGSFSSYCSLHKPAITIPIPVESWDCEVCYTKVEPNDFPVWPPCCKRRVFHRACIQAYAATSGYFFSCPCCKDKDIFIKAMKDSGVYVPEQDATWELAPNAFAELNQAYSHCDAEECLCPQGRSYDCDTNRSWKIVRCGSCGSSAIHYSCGQLTLIKWKCPECFHVLTRDPSAYRMVVLEGASTSDESDEDELSDEEQDDSCSESFRTTDENCRIEIATRSCLSGLEREADKVSNPVDYISSVTSSNGTFSDENETQGSRATNLKRPDASKRIVYNSTFRKKYKMDLALAAEESDSLDNDTREDDYDTYATRRTRLTQNPPKPSFVETSIPARLSETIERKENSNPNDDDEETSLNQALQVVMDNLDEKLNEFSDDDMDDLFATNETLCERNTRTSSKTTSKAKNTDQDYVTCSAAEKQLNTLAAVSEKRENSQSILDSAEVPPNIPEVSEKNNNTKSILVSADVSQNKLEVSEKDNNSKSILVPVEASANNAELSKETLMSESKESTSDSEEIEVIKEIISPKKHVHVDVIILDDTLEDDDDDGLKILMENVSSKSPRKQQESLYAGSEKRAVKSSALMEVLKTPSSTNEEVFIIKDDDDCQEVIIHLNSKERPKSNVRFGQENHEVISIDDEGQECNDPLIPSKNKRCHEDNDSDNKKTRFGSCDFETRSSQSENRKRDQAVCRNATKAFTVEINRPKIL